MNALPRRQRMKPDHRRAQLLECGVRVFARLGIGRASHAEIAREAGVSVATVFNYFPSRENLVNEVLNQIDSYLTDMVNSAGNPAQNISDALYNLVRTFADAANSHTDIIRVWLEWSTSIRDDTWPKYLDFQERVISKLREVILKGKAAGSVAADIDAEDAARMVVGDAHMVALMQFAHRDAAATDRFLRHMVESVLKIPSADIPPR